MRKLCSKCGNDLDLGSRFCPSCGAFNPFFISTFNSPSKQVLIPEKLLLEEPGLQSEEVSKAAEALITAREKQPDEKQKLIQESLDQERLEREKSESGLKLEIKKVKEETEQYKKETIEMVKEVREDLEIIGAENRRLKDELEALNRDMAAVKPDVEEMEFETPTGKKFSREIKVLMAVLVFGAAIFGSLGYFYVTKTSAPPVTSIAVPVTKPVEVANSPQNNESSKSRESLNTAATDTAGAQKADSASSVTSVKAPPTAISQPKQKDTPDFKLTPAKLRKDLVGKRLSGCGTQIDVESEIVELSEAFMIDKLPPNSFKFKFNVKFTQGGNSYMAVPYIYYDSYGNFIKIDGTNCE